MNKIYIETNKLPGAIGAALFHGEVSTKDLEFRAADRCCAVSGGEGKRAWLVIMPSVDSPDGIRSMRGAWGGSNPFQKHEIDEYTFKGLDVPEHGLVMTGAGRYVVCYVRAATLARLLAPMHPATSIANDASLEGRLEQARDIAQEAIDTVKPAGISNAIRWTLHPFHALKSSYRSDALRDISRKTNGCAGNPDMISDLIERGYLKRNSAGSISITTLGKNVAREMPYNATPTSARDVT